MSCIKTRDITSRLWLNFVFPLPEHFCPLFIQIAQMGLILPRWDLNFCPDEISTWTTTRQTVWKVDETFLEVGNFFLFISWFPFPLFLVPTVHSREAASLLLSCSGTSTLTAVAPCLVMAISSACLSRAVKSCTALHSRKATKSKDCHLLNCSRMCWVWNCVYWKFIGSKNSSLPHPALG